jgi:DNA-directed RNA polymerase I, II, and III subunit RPABC3
MPWRPPLNPRYAMYGKIFKWRQENIKALIEVQVSFGGLLMRLKGDPRHLQKLALDSRVYLLMRQIGKDL